MKTRTSTGVIIILLSGCGRDGSSSASRESQGVFTNVAAAAGLVANHVNGREAGKLYMVEAHNGGAAVLDFDADGFYDLYFVNGHADPENADQNGDEPNRLFRNNRDGTFAEVSAAAGAGDRGYGYGAAVGDYDGDGYADLLVTNFGGNVLYRNLGGSFQDVTAKAAVQGGGWPASAAFFDYDLDGDLDLYVCRYVDYHPRRSKACFHSQEQAYCGPQEFPGLPDLLYRNNGDGTFTDVSRSSGVGTLRGSTASKSLGVVALDFNDDGFQDLYVACDRVANILWENQSNGTFKNVGFKKGVAHNHAGGAEAGMGVDCADADGDGRMDIFVVNYSGETNTLYLHKGGFFEDRTMTAGLGAAGLQLIAFGTNFLDHDLDGDQDLYVACGHLEYYIEERFSESGETFRQRDLLFENVDPGVFREVSEQAPAWLARRYSSRGSASLDYDNDGDVDIFVVLVGDPSALLRNNRPPGNHYLTLKLVGTRSNRDAYGARVSVRAGGKVQVFEYRSARSFLTACDPRLHVGLGQTDVVDEIAIRWPSGRSQVLRQVPADRALEIVEE